ncbi:MAG: type II toxin-antitoxin system RelE/ParE family toxin [Sulfitobacter sp.]
MSLVAFSPAAAADLDNIWDHTVEEWGADQAARYTDDIQNTCSSLARGEKNGRDVDVRSGYLKHAVGKHFVFFRTTETGIEVIRILHQSMDVGRHL